MNVGGGCARIWDVSLDIGNDGFSICSIAMGIENNGVLVCSILIGIRVGYTCVLKFSLEAGG